MFGHVIHVELIWFEAFRSTNIKSSCTIFQCRIFVRRFFLHIYTHVWRYFGSTVNGVKSVQWIDQNSCIHSGSIKMVKSGCNGYYSANRINLHRLIEGMRSVELIQEEENKKVVCLTASRAHIFTLSPHIRHSNIHRHTHCTFSMQV